MGVAVNIFLPSLTAVIVVMAVACIRDSDSEWSCCVFTVTSGKSVTNHFSAQWFVLLHSRTPLSLPL